MLRIIHNVSSLTLERVSPWKNVAIMEKILGWINEAESRVDFNGENCSATQ